MLERSSRQVILSKTNLAIKHWMCIHEDPGVTSKRPVGPVFPRNYGKNGIDCLLYFIGRCYYGGPGPWLACPCTWSARGEKRCERCPCIVLARERRWIYRTYKAGRRSQRLWGLSHVGVLVYVCATSRRHSFPAQSRRVSFDSIDHASALWNPV